METTTRTASYLMAGNEAALRASCTTKSAADLWLDANIKTTDEGEYRRYRSYLVAEGRLADQMTVK